MTSDLSRDIEVQRSKTTSKLSEEMECVAKFFVPLKNK